MAELKPCPFCGAEAKPMGGILKTAIREEWKHTYNGCILSGFVIREDKVKIWNRRDDHLALEAETTQIIDGCCTACGALIDCCEAAEYEFCPMCGRKFRRDK